MNARWLECNFFNPAPSMRLVEVIAGLNTPEETVEAIKTISKDIGKTPVQVKEGANHPIGSLEFKNIENHYVFSPYIQPVAKN